MMTSTNFEEVDELESMVDGTYLPSESIGDPMDESPTHATTRLYIQNLNGLSWNKDGGKWPYVCEVLATTRTDIACFSELNTDTNRYDVRKTMEDVCRKQFDKHCLVLSTSSTKSITPYKPGGTAIIIYIHIFLFYSGYLLPLREVVNWKPGIGHC